MMGRLHEHAVSFVGQQLWADCVSTRSVLSDSTDGQTAWARGQFCWTALMGRLRVHEVSFVGWADCVCTRSVLSDGQTA